MLGDPRKNCGNPILLYIYLCIFIYNNMQVCIVCIYIYSPVANYYGNAPVMPAHAYATCSYYRLFISLSQKKGLGTKLTNPQLTRMSNCYSIEWYKLCILAFIIGGLVTSDCSQHRNDNCCQDNNNYGKDHYQCY